VCMTENLYISFLSFMFVLLVPVEMSKSFARRQHCVLAEGIITFYTMNQHTVAADREVHDDITLRDVKR